MNATVIALPRPGRAAKPTSQVETELQEPLKNLTSTGTAPLTRAYGRALWRPIHRRVVRRAVPATLIAVAAMAAVVAVASARSSVAGLPDRSFGDEGRGLVQDMSLGAAALAVDRRSGVILVGSNVRSGTSGKRTQRDSDIVMVRLRADGEIDRDFGRNGRVALHISSRDEGAAVAITRAGRILVAGTIGGNFALLRYRADGTPDRVFGSRGRTLTDFGGRDSAQTIALTTAGQIVLAGTSDGRVALARYRASGSLDRRFGAGGRVVIDSGTDEAILTRLALDEDGGIIVAHRGFDTATILRLSASGALDRAFGTDGAATIPAAFGSGLGLALDPVGSILTASTAVAGVGLDFLVAKFTPAGAPDDDFGTHGQTRVGVETWTSEAAEAIAVTPAGSVLVVGSTNACCEADAPAAFLVARLTAVGRLDRTFGSRGFALTEAGNVEGGARAITLTRDGKIVVAGYGSTEHESGEIIFSASYGMAVRYLAR